MAEVSVIVPVYRAEAYLADCVSSILNQTFSDLEVILVNDGSPDASGSLCDQIARENPKVKVLHQENQGQSAARNHALPLCEGQWLCYVDSDDLIHPQLVEKLLAAAKAENAGIAMCRMLEGERLPEDFLQPREMDFSVIDMDETNLIALYDREEYPGWVACAKLIRRELVEGYPFTPGRVYEDNEAVCRWICQGKRLALTEETLYFYRTNPESTTQKKFSIKRLDYLWALESIIGYYHSLGWTGMRDRFCDRYADAAANSHIALKAELNDGKRARAVEKNAWRFFRKHRIPMSYAQWERMMEGMHPKLTLWFWTVRGGLRTLKEEGIGGFLGKLKKLLRKGE